MVERLLAHARICREIAGNTLNEETARKLEELAQDCIQTARDVEPMPQFRWFQRAAAGRRAAN